MNFPRRIVGDHDVDRLQVEAWQHVEPRSTNHPFGLIPVFGIGIQGPQHKNTQCGSLTNTVPSVDIFTLHADASERARGGAAAGHESVIGR